MIKTDELSIGDWIDLYEYLNGECHLSEEGIAELSRLKREGEIVRKTLRGVRKR